MQGYRFFAPGAPYGVVLLAMPGAAQEGDNDEDAAAQPGAPCSM